MFNSVIKRIFIGFIILDLLFSFSNVNIETENAEIYSKDPNIVILYPKNLKNGSSYWYQENIYFTLGGNLSFAEYGDYVIRYYWNDESKEIAGTLINGVGIVYSPIGLLPFNTWCNLNFEIYYIEGKYKNQTLDNIFPLATHTFRFFLKHLVLWEPFGIVPVNYPNNSLVNEIGGANIEQRLIFKTEGFDIDLEAFSNGETVYARELNIEHRWDNQAEWMNASVNTARLFGYDYLPFNYWAIYPYNFQDNGTHDLYIKIFNSTHQEVFHFSYTIIERYIPKGYYIWNEDFFWRAGEIKPFLVSDTTYNVVYNWNDGTGNHTIKSTDWQEGWGGYKGCYNLTVPNLGIENVGYGKLSLWVDNTPRLEYAFSYETVIPQINLLYPPDNFPKQGMIPVIWSIQVCGRGRYNYDQYRFNIFYETLENEKKPIILNFNPLIDANYSEWDKGDILDYHLLKSLFLYDNTAIDPMLVGYEFIIPNDLINQTEKIRFIINETTTNTVANSSIYKISQDLIEPNFSPDPIQAALSDWQFLIRTPPYSNPTKSRLIPLFIIVSIAGISIVIITFSWYWVKRKR
ncbi:MAG: hypothetical protein BAJALOKI2v1_380028 [Promethearchaeota archaeon]|nr:MAG: hypothetical protein BAJALOKI2v1_380028 [Candidatus Lokiarchaeota archaeon]